MNPDCETTVLNGGPEQISTHKHIPSNWLVAVLSAIKLSQNQLITKIQTCEKMLLSQVWLVTIITPHAQAPKTERNARWICYDLGTICPSPPAWPTSLGSLDSRLGDPTQIYCATQTHMSYFFKAPPTRVFTFQGTVHFL